MGAWIETYNDLGVADSVPASHPVWVRGLKLHLTPALRFIRPSHPVWVRGLKRDIDFVISERKLVAPRVGAWIETKAATDITADVVVSHPVWVRGLKPRLCEIVQ